MPQKRYAYLIGANGPEHQHITPLQYAEKDVEHLQRALSDYPCAFSDVKSMIATHPSDVLTDLERLAIACERSDLLMVHFSGHGKVWGGRLYLICNTTQVTPRPLLSTAININQIKEILDQCNAKHKLLVLDCCHASTAHAGGTWRGEQELEIALESIKGSVSAILSACAPHKSTRELDILELYHDRGAGFLSWALAAACSEYFTTVSRDGALSLSDITNWLSGVLGRINQGLIRDEKIPHPRLLSERDIAGDDEIWFTGRRRIDVHAVSLEDQRQREEHVIHNQEPFLRQYCYGAEIGDFDEEKLLAYARKQQGFNRLPLGNAVELCKRLGLASSVGTPRRLAVLAFHRFPNRHIAPAIIRVTLRTLDHSIYSRDTIEGFLGEQVEKAVQWLISNLRTIREDVEVGQRIDRCEISEKALQELVVNAVLHRDYEAHESIHIKITPKHITITNPGRLNSAIAMSDSPFSYRQSHPRNPELLDVLVAQRWAEGIAHGFEIITEEFQKYGLPLPEITNLPGGLVQVIIQRPDISTLSDSEMIDANVTLSISDESIADTLIATEEGEAPIWHVPYARNAYFTGRDAQLAQLHTLLSAGKRVALAQAISGLGGIGKTQLALEYAYRYQKSYHDTFWVNADTEEALLASYVLLANVLHLPESQKTDQAVVVQAVGRWLRKHTEWLLIFDNLEDFHLLLQYVPVDRQGAILLTTRRQVTEPVAQVLELEVLSEEEAILFLLKRTRVLVLDASLEEASHDEIEGARAITRLLGHLPLALDQAGAYILETQCGFAEYQALFHTHQRQLLQRRTGEGIFAGHPDSVATTFRLNFEHVQQRNHAAADLLYLCAYLAPDAIAEEVLTKGAAFLGPALSPVAADAFLLNQAMESLQTYSLVRRDSERKLLSIHRLVQAVLQDQQESVERQTWAERAVQAVNAALPKAEYETWAQCERLLPMALFAAECIERQQMVSEEAGRLLFETASYLRERARYKEAEPLYLRASSIWEQLLGPDHPQVAYSLNNLAILYWQQGKYHEAEPLFLRALSIYVQSLEPERPNVAYVLTNLATLYHQQGKYHEAEPLFLQALAIREQQVGPEHPQVAYPLANLGLLYAEQGKYHEAEPLFLRALAIWEQSLGPEHPQVAYPLNGLAILYAEQGRYAEAEPLFLRALAIREQQLGPEHPDTAETLYDLATFREQQGHHQQALALYQRALAIREQALGPDHPKTHATRERLTAVKERVGHEAGALPSEDLSSEQSGQST